MTTNTQSRRRPLLMMDDDDCSHCSLDDVHRTLREAHQSHGLTNGSNFGRYFSMSMDLTSKMAKGNDEEDPQKRSLSMDDDATAASASVAPSVAPSVVRHSTGLSNAVASADRTLAKLEAFLSRSDSHSDLLSTAGCSLQSELNRLRNSERELHGLWAAEGDNNDDCSLDSWKMVGAGVSFMKAENADDDDVSDVSSMQLRSIAEETRSPAAPLHHHAANIATRAAGISFIKDDDNYSEEYVSDVSSIQQLSIAEKVTLPLDAMNIADKHGDNSAMKKPLPSISKTNPPKLKRLSLTSSTLSCTGSFVKELKQEVEEDNDVCPDSPIGTDISFDCSSSTCCSVEEGDSPLNHHHLQSPAVLTIPTLESYQESTEHDEDIFYAAVVDDEEQLLSWSKTPEQTMLDISMLRETSSAASKSAAVFHKMNVKCESSLMTLLRGADALAEILYGW